MADYPDRVYDIIENLLDRIKADSAQAQIPYARLASQLNTPTNRRQLRDPLGQIVGICSTLSLPILSALVVYASGKEAGFPGPGFQTALDQHNIKHGNIRDFCQNEWQKIANARFDETWQPLIDWMAEQGHPYHE